MRDACKGNLGFRIHQSLNHTPHQAHTSFVSHHALSASTFFSRKLLSMKAKAVDKKQKQISKKNTTPAPLL